LRQSSLFQKKLVGLLQLENIELTSTREILKIIPNILNIRDDFEDNILIILKLIDNIEICDEATNSVLELISNNRFQPTEKFITYLIAALKKCENIESCRSYNKLIITIIKQEQNITDKDNLRSLASFYSSVCNAD